MKILIVEEYAERERLALLLLAEFLRRRGHEVLLSNVWEMEADARRFGPEMVLDNISDSVAHFAGKWGWMDGRHRNVNLIWEQLVCPANLTRYRLPSELCTGFVDGRVSWGPAFAKIIGCLNPEIEPARMGITGSIKHAYHEFYRGIPREELRRFYPIDFDRFDHTVVIAESCFWVDRYDFAARRDSRPAGGGLPYVHEWALYSRDLKAKLVPLLTRVAAANPRVLFILRLHPGTAPEEQRRIEASFGLPNLKVNCTGEIGTLLHLADLLLASRSGSLVDAYFAGTPSVNLTYPDHAMRLSQVLTSVEDGFGHPVAMSSFDPDMLPELLALPARTAAQDALASEWFHGNGAAVFERVADFVEAVADAPALPKRLAPRHLRDREILRRRARHAVRAVSPGLARTLARMQGKPRKVFSRPSGGPGYDFTAVAEMLAERAFAPPAPLQQVG